MITVGRKRDPVRTHKRNVRLVVSSVRRVLDYTMGGREIRVEEKIQRDYFRSL